MALQTKEFSVRGVSPSGQITYTYILRVTENAIHPENNTSTITLEAILRQSYGGTAFSDWPIGVSCHLDGAQLFSQYTRQTVTGTGEHVLTRWTGEVTHQENGEKTITLDSRLWHSGEATYLPPELMRITGTVTLTPTAQGSTISAADAAIGSVAAIAINARSAAFTHRVSYRFGNLTGYIAPNGTSQTPVELSGRNIYWTVPEAFYQQIPNRKWEYCTLTCTTYHQGMAVGQPTSARFLVSAQEAACAPSVTGSVEDVNPVTVALTGDARVLIFFHSTPRATPTVTVRKGASLAQVRVNGAALTGSYLDMAADTDTFLFSALDSRGWTAQDAVQLTLLPYEKPTHRVTARRLAPGSEQVEVTVTGSFFPCDFGAAENSLTLQCAVDSRNPVEIPVTPALDGSYQVTFTMEGVPYTRVSRLTVTATDRLEAVSVGVSVQRGEPVFRWDAESFTFHVPVTALGGISGLHMAAAHAPNILSWEGTGQTQPVFLFGLYQGAAVFGALAVAADGSCTWNGTAGLSFTRKSSAKLQLPEGMGQTVALSPMAISLM